MEWANEREMKRKGKKERETTREDNERERSVSERKRVWMRERGERY